MFGKTDKKIRQEKVDRDHFRLRATRRFAGGGRQVHRPLHQDGPSSCAVARRSVTVDADTDSSVQYDGPLAVMITVSAVRPPRCRRRVAGLRSRRHHRDISRTQRHGAKSESAPVFSHFDSNDPGTVKITIRKFYRSAALHPVERRRAGHSFLPDVAELFADIGETALEIRCLVGTPSPV